jgi:hypothetical protein
MREYSTGATGGVKYCIKSKVSEHFTMPQGARPVSTQGNESLDLMKEAIIGNEKYWSLIAINFRCYSSILYNNILDD